MSKKDDKCYSLSEIILFELQTKDQGKYQLPFPPTSQPSVRCCKMFVIECFRKFKIFLQKNRTADGNVVTTHQCKSL